MNPVHFSSESQEYATPDGFYGVLDAQFSFTLDAAAAAKNHKAPRFFNKAIDAFSQSWAGETIWLNPPYGRGLDGIAPWMKRARAAALYERSPVVVLPPARVDTDWWRRYVMQEDGAAGDLRSSRYFPEVSTLALRWEGLLCLVHHVAGRLAFTSGKRQLNGESAAFPNAVVALIPNGWKRPPLDEKKLQLHRLQPFGDKAPMIIRAWLG